MGVMKKTATLFFQFFLPISNSIMQPSCTTVIMYYTVCAFQKETSATLANIDNPFKTMSSDFFAFLTSRFSTGAMCNGNAHEKMRWRPAPYIRFPGNQCCGSVSCRIPNFFLDPERMKWQINKNFILHF